jgi:hypothetical protein
MNKQQYEEFEADLRFGNISYDQVADEVQRMWATIERLRAVARFADEMHSPFTINSKRREEQWWELRELFRALQPGDIDG